MTDCCNDKACEIEALRARQSSTLKVVLAINAGVFAVELTSGLAAGSVSLLADSLDMLGDALIYAFSIHVVSRGERHKALSALLKAGDHGSRNDIIAKLSVLVAALAVWWLGSGWPDILVGVALSGLVLESSASVLRGAVTTLPVAHA